METRLLLAYLLMALMFIGVSAAILYATREMRALRRAQKEYAKTRRQTRAQALAEQKG